MEYLAHTLLGLSLAKAGLERSTPLATTALVLSSNLTDIDIVVQLTGGLTAYLEHHRGFTHGFVGAAVVAAGLTLILMLVDKLFRLRGDPFRRPIMPMRIFFLSYLGGLGHAFMDYTNSYGIRPLEPFDSRWFYGDLVFVVDPWIWLILGSAVVWLTARGAFMSAFWFIVGSLTGLVVALARRNPAADEAAVPDLARIIWFAGLAIIIVGALARWGRRGPGLARWALLLLAFYYGASALAHRSAITLGFRSPPAEAEITRIAAWPVPANPTVWQAVASGPSRLFRGNLNIQTKQVEWREAGILDADIAAALRTSRDGEVFLRFARFVDSKVEETPEGYNVLLRDLRFGLQLRAELDRELTVLSTEVKWN
jgi:inner membrane protein